jgi:hypothetical protein
MLVQSLRGHSHTDLKGTTPEHLERFRAGARLLGDEDDRALC